MDSYKLKKIIIFVSVIAVNLIFVTMASVSIMQSITKQLKEEKNSTSISKNSDDEEEQKNKIEEEESPNEELSIDFNSIITYLKSPDSGKILASLEILIGVNLVVISILILLRLRRNG